jgi:hypothetical protein
MRPLTLLLLTLAVALAAQAQCGQKPDPTPAANPARPTLSVPAVLPPTGYLQFEQGFNRAVTSPSGTAAQSAVNQATKIALTSRILVELLSAPFTYNTVFTSAAGGFPSSTIKAENAGDLDLGAQLVLLKSTGPQPTVDLGYIHRVRAGTAANLDAGDFNHSAVLYLSGDLPHGVHYDSDYQFNEQRSADNASSVSYNTAHPVRRLQLVQTISVSHPIFPKSTSGRLSLDLELEHYTQPLVTSTSHNHPFSVSPPRANAVDLLVTTPFALRPNLVFDAAVVRGLTSTSTQWQGTVGVTWLLPHRLLPTRKSAKTAS